MVSVSSDTFKKTMIAPKDDVFLHQSVVFRITEVYKGSPSGDFVGTMIAFPPSYAKRTDPEYYELKKGDDYILILVIKFASDDCKRGPEKAFPDLRCYELSYDRLIRANDDEAGAFRWMFQAEKAGVYPVPGKQLR